MPYQLNFRICGMIQAQPTEFATAFFARLQSFAASAAHVDGRLRAAAATRRIENGFKKPLRSTAHAMVLQRRSSNDI
jgi:hypothetical protein